MWLVQSFTMTVYLQVSPSATVLEVKNQLQTQVSIPVEQQKLIHCGKALSGKALSNI